ncbi:MAG TPA: DUF6249 domain-containing protein, partial [Rhodanobacteraceae bacterium]|nr:DUF6249 domain-containing protein [Rhodanobacteraceae bacterium]
MRGSTWRKTALLVGCLAATPLALAQETAPHEMTAEMTVFIALMASLGMAFVVAIVATASYFQQRQTRERLALIERLVLADKPVPRHLITGEIPPLPLPDERRRDIRRGITLLCWAIAVTAIPVIGS